MRSALAPSWVPAGGRLTSVRDRTWQMHQDPVEPQLGFLFIKKKVLGDSIPVSRRSKTRQVGAVLGLGAGELSIGSWNFRTQRSSFRVHGRHTGGRKVSGRARSGASGDGHFSGRILGHQERVAFALDSGFSLTSADIFFPVQVLCSGNLQAHATFCSVGLWPPAED